MTTTPDPEPFEYTRAGSPVAVLHEDGTDVFEIHPLPGRTLDESLAEMGTEEVLALMNSLAAALDEEDF
ncbi:hypothetical protein GCM10023194_81230 [Planotetraspora phitsanulokensis]|uniref:Uncharacterized protein n=1 Tax=Planotetraspora phitsanulokensis TaxID=575192 RepID=A0A8J3UCT4_9ACTN|nr:hypothetical protein [Planotetraspora phitsanulokensis]GII42863.1 hypothetical protein Pph01_78660 [Planotetraspora phitsanulokensis]